MGRNGRFLTIVGLMGVTMWLLGSQPLVAQTEPTSTPDVEGIIYDTVRSDDTMWAVSYRNGITLEELLAFNNLTESDFIHPWRFVDCGHCHSSGHSNTSHLTHGDANAPATHAHTNGRSATTDQNLLCCLCR